MSPEEKKILQTLVDDSFKDFKAIVASGRPSSKIILRVRRRLKPARSSPPSKRWRMAWSMRSASSTWPSPGPTKLAGESESSVRCVKYEKRPTFFSSVLGSETQVPARGMADLSAVLDLATPRAYYLWSWLPATLSNSH